MITPSTANVTCACKDVFLYSLAVREKNGLIHSRTGCIPVPKLPTVTCEACGETFWVLGETPIARARALRDWSGCPCTQTPSPSSGEGGGEGASVGADRTPPVAAGADAPSSGSRSVPALFLSRLLSGVPDHARRRWQAWPIDPTDLRAH